jgi:hypothetical protein
MSVRAVTLLGFFLTAASLLHGGIYVAGHDFVVNRFTGAYAFVPAEDYDREAVEPAGLVCALTSRKVGVRVARRGAERRSRRTTPVGR